MSSGVALLWFRRDLPLLDNKAWEVAVAEYDGAHACFVIPTTGIRPHPRTGLPRWSPRKATFVAQCVEELAGRLSAHGVGLTTVTQCETSAQGVLRAVHAITAACPDSPSVTVLYNHLPGPAEVAEEADLVATLHTHKIKARGFWSWMLYPPEELPWHVWRSGPHLLPVAPTGSSSPTGDRGTPPALSTHPFHRIPFIMNHFLKAVEGEARVPTPAGPRPPISEWQRRSAAVGVDRTADPSGSPWGAAPSADSFLGCTTEAWPGTVPDTMGHGPEIEGHVPMGGETAALAHLQDFVSSWLEGYGASHGGVRSAAHGCGSGLAPWLAWGALSPRVVHERVTQAVQATVSVGLPDHQKAILEQSAAVFLRHIAIRDFFAYTALREGEHAAAPAGFGHRHTRRPWKWQPPAWASDGPCEAFWQWAAGRTGLPFVDAGMRELRALGGVSNKSRQNCVSFLVNDLRLPWPLGAEVFETFLIDYEPSANFGNWLYFSGLGCDPKRRHFRTVSQGEQWDPEGSYIRRCVQPLSGLGQMHTHRPWLADPAPPGYPPPCVDTQSQIKWVWRQDGRAEVEETCSSSNGGVDQQGEGCDRSMTATTPVPVSAAPCTEHSE